MTIQTLGVVRSYLPLLLVHARLELRLYLHDGVQPQFQSAVLMFLRGVWQIPLRAQFQHDSREIRLRGLDLAVPLSNYSAL